MKEDKLIKKIETALQPGQYIDYNQASSFIRGLEKIKNNLIHDSDAKRAVGLFEIFISGCYDKVEEIDDSGEDLSMFFQELFILWINARQKADFCANETVKIIIRWMDNDDYGFCYKIEKDLSHALDEKGYLLFLKHFEDSFEKAYIPFKDQESKYLYDYPHTVIKLVKSLIEIYMSKADIKSYIALMNKIRVSPLDCENIASLYVAKNQFNDALEWIDKGISLEKERKWHNQSGWALSKTRRKLLWKLGRHDDAFADVWEDFMRSPCVYAYEEAMEYISKDEMQEWHTKAMNIAEDGSLRNYLNICVFTGELEALTDRILSVKQEELEKAIDYGSDDIAKVLEKDYKEASARIYRIIAMQIVGRGKSKYYKSALIYFQKTKILYEKIGQKKEWLELVYEMRKLHKRKYSFIGPFEEIVAGKTMKSQESFETKARNCWKKRTS